MDNTKDNKSDSEDKNTSYRRVLTKEELLEKEREIDEYDLIKKFRYEGKIIKKYSDLRKIATSIEIIESLENKLDDDEYIYIYQWFLCEKLLKSENK